MTRIALALVHHPCLDKDGQVFTTSITNLDVHDIARAATSYACDAFYVVTPVSAQQEMARRIVGFWEEGPGQRRNPDRTTAMRIVHVVASVSDAIAAEEQALGARPLVVATSARAQGTASSASLRARLPSERGALVLFGTGHGLAPSLVDGADVVLAPLVGRPDKSGGYNHLSVRSAAAIYLDRLLAVDP
ncbi:MAG: RNA methyltransferase [Deltaproteobacteria bacterium]|nr:RNA methyltransferase [Deltaproteobacteria bacterium]